MIRNYRMNGRVEAKKRLQYTHLGGIYMILRTFIFGFLVALALSGGSNQPPTESSKKIGDSQFEITQSVLVDALKIDQDSATFVHVWATVYREPKLTEVTVGISSKSTPTAVFTLPPNVLDELDTMTKRLKERYQSAPKSVLSNGTQVGIDTKITWKCTKDLTITYSDRGYEIQFQSAIIDRIQSEDMKKIIGTTEQARQIIKSMPDP